MEDKKANIDALETIEFDVLNDNFEGDWSMVEFAINLFQENYSDPYSKLKKVVESGDCAEIRNAAHSIKGVVHQLGAKGLVDQLQVMEDEAKDSNIDQVKEILISLKLGLNQLVKDIEALKSC